MTKTESYKDHVLESLKDPEAAAQYLTACLEDNNPEVFLLALRDVAEARGGMRKLSEQTSLNRENLYRMLSESSNPSLSSLGPILSSMGLRFAVEAK